MHMGIGAGNFTGVFVGGAFGRMEYILAGNPMKQVSVAEPIAVSGETGISPEAFGLLPEHCAKGRLVTDLPDEYYADMPIKKTAGTGTPEEQRKKRKSEHREESRRGYRLFGRHQFQDAKEPPAVPAEVPSEATADKWTEQLKHYIPAAVTEEKLTLANSDHVAENLTVSVIFISIDGIELGAKTPGEAPAIGTLAQRLMLRIQETIYQWEGSVNKLMVDDKGLLVLCALGLPPMRHGDDPYRAVCAALDIPDAIKRVHPDARVKVGVSTGQAFCGIVGHSELRREYTVMGTCVNLCARLMTSCEFGSVLVDEQTFKAASGGDFSDPMRKNMKGIGFRNCYTPITKPPNPATKKTKEKKAKKKDYDKVLLKLKVGRDDEIASLHSMLGRCKLCSGGLILITGERGQGKTFMLDQAWDIAEEPWADMIRFKSEADKSEKAVMAYKEYEVYNKLFQANGEEYEAAYPTSVYPAWRGVISDIVEDGAKRAGQTVVEWVSDALVNWDDGGLQEHTSLLIEFLPLGCTGGGEDETAREVMLKYGATLDLIGNLLCTMLWRFGKLNGMTLIKVHLQKNSSVISAFNEMESWQLLKKVTDMHCNIVIVVGSRTFSPADAKDPVVKNILDDCQQSESVLDLKNFGESHSRKFAAMLLSSREVQAYPFIGQEKERGLAPTETYTITKEDLPPPLKTMLFDVAQGNPKNIIEVLDPLLSGYSKPTDYISQNVNTYLNSDDWSHPVIKITGNHEIKILNNPATMQPYNLDQFPWPAKVVQYIEQTFQELQDHKQHLLRVASIFKHGFTAELLRPFIETFSDDDLRELVGHGFLMKLGAEWFSETQWDELARMDPTVTTVFCFSSTLLQRLISARIVQREREHLERVKKKAIVRCRWMRLFRGWSEMVRARELLERHGFKVALHTRHRKDSVLIHEAKDIVESLRVKRKESSSTIRAMSSPLDAIGESAADADADDAAPDSPAPGAAALVRPLPTAAAPSTAFMVTYMLIGAFLALIVARFTSIEEVVESVGKGAGLW